MKSIIFTFTELFSKNPSPKDLFKQSKSHRSLDDNTPFSEDSIKALVHGFSKAPGHYSPTLLYAYGEYLFRTIAVNHKAVLERFTDSFTLLARIENYIHMEILKLHPDADLPSLEVQFSNQSTLELKYRAAEGMSGLAKGLIQNCINYFKEDIIVSQQALDEIGEEVLFILTKTDSN